MLLSMSFATAPLLANDAKDAGKEESPAKAVTEKAKETAKPENAVIAERLTLACCSPGMNPVVQIE